MPETPFPMVPSTASFAGPIDTISFRLRPDLGLTNFQKKAYAFVRLSTYFQTPIPNAPPYAGHHGFQVLLFIPTAKSPWAERFDWLQTSNRLGSHGQWVSVTGPVVGILDSRLLVESCRPNDDSPILVVVPQLIALPSGKERIPVIKTEPSREMVAQPITSVASPSTPTPKRVSRNPWSSPSKALSSALDRTPSRQTSSTAPSPLSVVAPVDLSKDPDDATEAVLGMFCFVFLCCGDSADIVETPSADRFYPVIVPGHKRAASSGSDILPPRKIPRRAGAGTRKPRA